MRIVAACGAALALSLFVAAPALAQDKNEATRDVPEFSGMGTSELVQTLRSSGRRWMEQPCEFGRPLFAALVEQTPGNTSAVKSLSFAKILCADERGEYEKGAAILAELEAASPELDLLDLGLYFHTRLDDADGALARLGALDFGSIKSLTDERFWAVARMLVRQGRADDLEDLALDWSQTGLFGAISREMQSSLSFRAIRAAIRQDSAALVPDLLGVITSPESYIALLTRREYEAAWPEIEKRAGPNLSLIGAEDVRLKQARLGNDTDDRDRFSALAYALHYNGQFEDAVALAEQWRRRENRGKQIEEGDAWALNIQANAFDSLGRPEKADAIFDELAALDPAEHPWVVNFVINRASRLVGHGRWEEGLEAAKLARKVADEYGSLYAQTIVAKDHACALRQLGRREEAGVELDFLRANSAEGLYLAAQALLCHDLGDEAAELLMSALADPTQRDNAASAFESGPLRLFYSQSILPTPHDLLDTHPELAAELANHVRPMPKQFIPQASLKRVVLDLPEWE